MSDTEKPSKAKAQFSDVLQLPTKYTVTLNVELKIEAHGGRVAQDTRDVPDHDAMVDAGGLLLWMLAGRQAGRQASHLALLLAIVRRALSMLTLPLRPRSMRSDDAIMAT